MWKNASSYLLYLLITVLVVCLYFGDFGGFQKLQWKIDDLLYSFRGSGERTADIVLVTIDDQTVQAYGEWPWTHNRLADLIAVCNSGEPRTMLINLDLSPRESEDTTGNTGVLATQLSWSDKVVLTYEIVPTDYSNQRMSRPQFLYKYSLQTNSDLGILNEDAALNARKLYLPSGVVAQYADGLGFSYVDNDPDKKVRRAPLVCNYEGYYYPSAALLTAGLYLGESPDQIAVKGGHAIQLGSRPIPTDQSGRLFLNFKKPNTAYTSVSAAELLQEEYNPVNLKDKLVIIGLAGTIESELYRTPIASAMTRTELCANVIDNIIHGDYITSLEVSTGLNLLILVGFGIFCMLFLPRMILLHRIIVLFFCLFILANVNVVMFSFYDSLMKSLYLGLEILLFLLISPMLETDSSRPKLSLFSFFKRSAPETPTRIERTRDSSRTTPKRDLQDTRGVPEMHPSEHEADVSASSTDYSTPAAQFPEPTLAFDSGKAMASQPPSPAPLDVEPTPEIPSEPLPVPVDAFETSAQPTTQSAPIPTGLNDSDRLRNLGRYQVIEVLGKGAMGTVYKGIDPAINRPVALKTIRLDFVSDQEEMAELRERLFREAQAAGKLSHPNIVTIYDVGSEGNLQYIAMEYLEGQTLESLVRKKVQFSYKIIANIITQICGALQYAHDQGIVHRDIKPANIMVLPNYSIKVMDFGIARVDSSSMTRTGIAMGTPNYISPEQLQGKAVDRRCDIFSLGVVVYELLTGRRPFRGENLTALIYSIINDEPPSPSTINENMPLIFDHITAKALKKNPTERYQKASDMQAAVIDFVDSFARPQKVGY